MFSEEALRKVRGEFLDNSIPVLEEAGFRYDETLNSYRKDIASREFLFHKLDKKFLHRRSVITIFISINSIYRGDYLMNPITFEIFRGRKKVMEIRGSLFSTEKELLDIIFFAKAIISVMLLIGEEICTVNINQNKILFYSHISQEIIATSQYDITDIHFYIKKLGVGHIFNINDLDKVFDIYQKVTS